MRQVNRWLRLTLDTMILPSKRFICMTSTFRSVRFFVGVAWLGVAGCGDDDGRFTTAEDVPPVDVVDARADVRPDRVVPDVVRDVVVNTTPLVVGVVPDHGPFSGGNEVVVRGTNFTEDAVVRFGGSLVQPRDTRLTDSRRLTVLPPAGRVGQTDVEVEINGRRAVLPMGYHYDAFYAEPNEGSIGGGTLITLRGFGTNFTESTVVTIDGLPCTTDAVQGPDRMTCRTPAHVEGRTPITVTTGDEAITVADAFKYADSPESTRGGLGGGAIQGSVSLTILSAGTGDAIPGAYVWAGDDPNVESPRSTRTDVRGRATLSYPELRGPVSVSVSARCFNSHTVQVFDARNVTLYLYPQMVPACAMGDPPGGGGGRGTFGTNVSGELIWDGPNEFAPNPWRNVPLPRQGERRVAYVYATQADILYPTVAPGDGGTVYEVVQPGYGGRGYPFAIVARPSAMAIYAIAGIENARTQRFTPYIMGVARNVLGAPRAEITRVAVQMNIPLDHQTQVSVNGLPSAVRGEPNQLRLEAFIDLGGEGVIARPDIAINTRDPDQDFWLTSLPAFTGTIADARLTVRGVYGTGTYLNSPLTAVVISGITTPDETVRLRNWIGIPNVTAPTDTGSLPNDRSVRFDLDGTSPDMWWINLSGDTLYWQTFAPGSVRSFLYPDVSRLMGLNDLPPGQQLYMSITGLRVPGFEYNNLRYTWLSQYYWTAYSARTLLFMR
jgi:hypothetical protein